MWVLCPTCFHHLALHAASSVALTWTPFPATGVFHTFPHTPIGWLAPDDDAADALISLPARPPSSLFSSSLMLSCHDPDDPEEDDA
jgi:hypothetical protein